METSRYSTGKNSNVALYDTPATSNSSGDSSSNSFQQSTSESTSFSGISNTEALATLMNFIKQAAGGGSEDFKNQSNLRKQTYQNVSKTSQDYSKAAAFADAKDLMAQNLQKSLDANMPAIAASIVGAGTSGGSMQALLSQKLATESAQAAGALGATQATAYGNISANLASVLEKLSQTDNTSETNLLKALELLKVATSQSRSQSTGESSSQSSQRSDSVGANNKGMIAGGTNISGGSSSGSGGTSETSSPFSMVYGEQAEGSPFNDGDYTSSYFQW